MGNCISTENDVFIYDDYIFEKDLKLIKLIKFKNLKYHRRKKIYDIFKLEIKK
jgi:hypothetical protein